MKNVLTLFCVVASLFLSACSEQNNAMFSGLLSSTGLVSGSQADALVKAGSHVAKAAESLSDEEEYYVGRGVAATVLSKYRPYQNAEATAYANKVLAVVAAVSDRPETFGGYHVQLLDSNEINALSGPGGFIFVTSGFLKIMPDEDALAAVLAHEVGHVVKGHGLKAISEANYSEALLLLGKEAAASQGGAVVQQLTSTFGDSISDIANTLLTKGYSRSQEYEADEYAAELLKKAGYSPSGLLAMLDAVEKHGAGSGGWLSTHPAPADRREEIGSAAEGNGSEAARAIRQRRFNASLKRLG